MNESGGVAKSPRLRCQLREGFKTGIAAMQPKTASVWVPFIYSAVLSAITLIANIASAFITGQPNAGMIPFLAFLPMAFYFVAMSQKQHHNEIQALETRIRQLEGK
jgi:hypothetical protein